MNPNNLQPPMTPQGPPAGNPWMPGGSAQPSNPQQAAMQGQQSNKGKAPQMPSMPFTASHNHIYNTLRNSLMELVKQGIPGMEKVLAALNNEHVNGIKSQSQQAPTMPQGVSAGEIGQVVRPPMPGGQ